LLTIGQQDNNHSPPYGYAPVSDRRQLARDVYQAFAAADREAIERLLADDFEFHAPPDPHLDRAGYFERCWPHAGGGRAFEFARLIESGDEVVVTYERPRPDGTRFRNTEVLTFAGDTVRRAEVYFGWDLA
jgi:ketosteroid isomerase-like protein